MKPLKEALISKSNRDWASTDIKYNITKKDMIGDLAGIPVGVVIRMLEEQEKQGNKVNIKVFQRNCCADRINGGFDWTDTNIGHAFWDNVIFNKNFDNFFKEYPEYKKYN
jgi:uncharacterized protein YjdB